MKYTDLSINLGFQRNMRETSWLKLFPHWWSENDPLITAIGEEIAFIKAQSVFKLLNATVKPPVLLWQTAINHKEYISTHSIEKLPYTIDEIPAPLYETYGKITITNYTENNIYDLTIALNDVDYITIKDTIRTNDIIELYVGTQDVYLNNQKTKNIHINEDGLSYYKTSMNKDPYDPHDPLHNEILRITISANSELSDVLLDTEIKLENAVFITEQNIEITGLELIPIDKVELYAYYDFPYHDTVNGWRKVYDKEYDANTNVLYDMITTQFYTKQFYAEVWFKGLDYAYKVGFPCDKNASSDSMYHVNNRLDEWGSLFGLPRRLYKENIPKEDYPFTFPIFYPYNIEQDYWYYLRLISEYTSNDLAINDVDLLDTDNNPIVRLHSINPFVEDFAIHAKSKYPIDKYNIYSNTFTPTEVHQQGVSASYKRVPYYDTHNLLRYDDNKAYVTLSNKSGVRISAQQYISKQLWTFFDVNSIPDDVTINDIEVIVEAESTDNSLDKFSNADTGLVINGLSETYIFPMEQTDSYELEEKKISYVLKDNFDNIKKEYTKNVTDENVLHQAMIKQFTGLYGAYIDIPFELKENGEIIDDITEVYVTYNDVSTYKGTYRSVEWPKETHRFINVFVPKIDTEIIKVTISCKTENHNSFLGKNIIFKNTKVEQTEDDEITSSTEYISGPFPTEDATQTEKVVIEDEWHTGDFKSIVEKDGIYFVNTYENSSDSNTPTILIKNITLKVTYEPKKSNFVLDTDIKKDNIKEPTIGRLEVTLTNTGDKKLSTQVDLVCADNIKLDTNYIKVDLNMGESDTTNVNITPQYPILDGIYEIMAICEDKISTNAVEINTTGLIQTGITMSEHYGTYNQPLTFQAKVGNSLNLFMDSNISTVSFYVDGYRIHDNPVLLENGIATLTIQPSENKFLSTGIHILEARFSGTKRFAPSRKQTTLIIARNNVDVNLELPEFAVYNQPCNLKLHVNYINGLNTTPVNEGNVTFYIGDTNVGTVQVVNGVADILTEPLSLIPKEYNITAIYNGTDIYARTETYDKITIIGGKTTVNAFDINSTPDSDVILKARITDMYNAPLKSGECIFKIKNNDQIIFEESTSVKNGIANIPYHIPNNILASLPQDTILQYTIDVSFSDSQNYYESSSNTATLTIKRRDVIIDCSNIFYASQYEPIGFYAKIKDAETGEPVTDGTITFNVPQQNIFCEPTQINSDGGVRVVFNPINFNAKEFKTLLNFYLRIGSELPLIDKKGKLIKLFKDNDYESIKNFDIVTDVYIENQQLTYETKPCTNKTTLRTFNNCPINLSFYSGKIFYDQYSTPENLDDLTRIENLEDLSVLNGLIFKIEYKDGVIEYKEFRYGDPTAKGFNSDNLYRIYDGKLSDLDLMDFYLGGENNTQLIYHNNHKYNNDIENELYEHIYIDGNGHLYARSNIDTLRQYTVGTYPVEIQYTSQYKYKSISKQSNIKFSKGQIDVDIQPYDLIYGDPSDTISCYVTEYNLNETNISTPVNTGRVHFFIDGLEIGDSGIIDGVADFPIIDIDNLTINNHLLAIEYIPIENKEPTYTYANFIIRPIVSTVTGELNRQFENKQSELYITIAIDEIYEVPISGNVNIYLDDNLIDSNYLFGLEAVEGNATLETEITYENVSIAQTTFTINMPSNITTENHILRIEYEGNQYINSSEYVIELHKQQTNIDIKTEDKYAAQGEMFSAHYYIEAVDDDDINEGQIVIKEGETIKAIAPVKHNYAYVEWLIDGTPNNTYNYSIEYQNGINYKHPEKNGQTIPIIQKITVITALNDAYIAHENYEELPMGYPIEYTFNNIEDALLCVKNGGNIHILDYNYITYDININKDVNIIGTNNSKIIKDLPNLLDQEIGTLKIYTKNDFTNTIYEVKGMKIEHLNSIYFNIINSNLFFTGNDNLVPIYLLSDGKFYTDTPYSLSTLNGWSKINIKDGKTVTFNNIIFDSNEFPQLDDVSLAINNHGTLTITKSIINKHIAITGSSTDITINTSAIYGSINTQTKDIDNNWWGTNTLPQYIKANNHIQLELYTKDTPPVIGSDIIVYAELKSTNGLRYNLPPVDFRFSANTGVFSVEAGKMIDGKIQTTYTDCAEETQIYCTIDNETVSLDILDYDRKVELVFEHNMEIPIGYQVPISVKVQSLADTFYKFNEENQTIKQTQTINKGFVKFYIKEQSESTYKQIGRVKVNNGLAEIPFFTSPNQYPIVNNGIFKQYDLDIKAEYEPEDYYFAAEQEDCITLVDESYVCYVSPDGTSNADGTFLNPIDSIGQAISKNKQRIYLFDGIYNDVNIKIKNTQYIKKYNGECIFKNATTPIFISENNNSELSLDGLTFIENNNYIANNFNFLNIQHCILQNNNHTLINNGSSTIIQYSVIINDVEILSNYNKWNDITFCWFGTNNLSTLKHKHNFDKYVIMDYTSTKENIYIGSVAYITGRLTHYTYNGEKFLLEDYLPLRVAKFDTEFGSFMPIKDYTYHNQSTSFLNTQDSYTLLHKPILSLPDNTNYINEPYKIQCYVKNMHDENIDTGKVLFTIKKDNTKIQEWGEVINGVATLESSTPLEYGEYSLECEYRYDEKNTVKIFSTFKVIPQSIIVKKCTINDTDHLYDLTFDAEFTNSVGKLIQNQKVNIYIDDILITDAEINNGQLHTSLYYNSIIQGKHKLKISTIGYESSYTELTYKKDFTSTKKNTLITFDYIGIPANEPTDLTIKVYDDNQRIVNTGSIQVIYDNELYDEIELQHGTAILYNFTSEKGMHSFIIKYQGDNNYYNPSLLVKNDFNVDLDEVIIDTEELRSQLYADLGQTFRIHFPIYDKFNHLVKRGKVNLYIDNNIPLTEEPLPVENGYVTFEQKLNVNAMTHDFIIKYEDTALEPKYISTTLNTNLQVKPISVQIITNPNIPYLAPNSKTSIPYEIQSMYGQVTQGMLYAYLDDELLNFDQVSNYDDYIDIVLGNIATNDPKLVFKYIDDSGNYGNVIEEKDYIINKSQITISTDKQAYYPNVNFDFIVTLTNTLNQSVTTGMLTLYIDGSKHTSEIVYDGIVTFNLKLETIKEYDFTLIYEENDYYAESTYTQKFNIHDVPINNIQAISVNDAPIYPNSKSPMRLNFTTPNNEDVKDGFIDFTIDKHHINTYSVVEGIYNKYVNLNIPNIDAGTYELEINYYGSNTYQDYPIDEGSPKCYIHINPIPVQIQIQPFAEMIELNDNINIVVTLDKNINGLLDYYLVSTLGDSTQRRYIATEPINKRTTIELPYILPSDIDSNAEHQIEVELKDNNQYVANIAPLPITIHKSNVTSTLLIEDTIEYQGILEAKLFTNITSDNRAIFYLNQRTDSNKIKIVTPNENNEIQLQYKMSDQYKPGDTFKLICVIPESATFNEVYIEKTITVTKATTILSTTYIDNVYRGQTINLPSNITTNKGIPITEGTIEYYLNDRKIATGTPNTDIPLEINFTQENIEFSVKHIFEDEYNIGFDDTTVAMAIKKNKLSIDIENHNAITRGIPSDNKLLLKSTTLNTNNINSNNFRLYIELDENNLIPITINNDLTFTINLPLTTETRDAYLLKVEFTSDNIFEQKTVEFNLKNQNQNNIILTEDNLDLAFELVADNGTLTLEKDIKNWKTTNNKTVTIDGNNHKLINPEIQNNGKLTIKNINFVGSNSETNNSMIRTNNELYANNCTFSNNKAMYGAAIYIDSRNQNTEITKCVFNNNYATLYGGAIFSNQGNDVTIKECEFTTTNRADSQGSSIASSGNIYISKNIFTNNYVGKPEIYIISGSAHIENNYLDGKNKSIYNANGQVNANFNYWGYNNFDDFKYDGDNILIDSWLISGYDIERKQTYNEAPQRIITPLLNKYRNRLEQEDVTYNEAIQGAQVLFTCNNNQTTNGKIGKPTTITNTGKIKLLIGQEEFIIEE